MSETPRHKTREIFLLVADLPHDARRALLDAQCAGNQPLREAVEELLRYHDESPEFLARPAIEEAGIDTSPADAGILAPDQPIGPYRVLRCIGAGGMGVVYAARQQSPSRDVAIKVIRPGLISGSLLRRFRAEAAALGRLQHPGIAQIYEASVPYDGPGNSPFIVMELIDGLSITDHASRHKLTVPERVELFSLACDAVHHAHQRGVIHRDLKPTNILVTVDGQPKVLDFGVARVMEAEQGGVSQRTQDGQLIGTVAYMPPENIRTGAGPDVRGDVYSLGIILFELLCNRLPFDVHGKPVAELARMVRDDEPLHAAAVRPELRGDLDAIIATAMHQDPHRRYQSAADFATDLRRFLRSEAVAARQDSTLYLFGKSVRRHRTVYAVGLIIAISLVLFLLHTWREADRFRRLAESESAAKSASQLATIKATTAEAESAKRALELDQQLFASNIERGRLEALTGNAHSAEQHLWTAHLNKPDSARAAWALRELYTLYPCLATAQASQYMVTAVKASPDLSLIAAGDQHGTLHVLRYDPSSTAASPLATHSIFSIGRAPVRLVHFLTPSTIICVTSDGSASAWTLATPPDQASATRLWEFPSPGESSCDAAAVSRDGALLAFATYNGDIRLLDTTTGAVVSTLSRGTDTIYSLDFSPDGSTIIASTRKGTLAVFDRATGRRTHDRPITSDYLYTSIFSPDGTRIAAGARDRHITVSTFPDWIPRAAMDPEISSTRALSFSPDGRTLLSAGPDDIHTWDAESGRLMATLRGHRSRITSGVYAPNGTIAITGGEDGVVKVWSTDPYGGATLCAEHTSWVFSVALHPTLPLIVSSSGDFTIRIWDRAGKLAHTIRIPADRCRVLRFTPDGSTLLASCNNGVVYRYSTSDWSALPPVQVSSGEIYALTPSPAVQGSNVRYAAGGIERVIRFLDDRGNLLDKAITGVSHRVVEIHWAHDGATLIAASDGGVLRWDARTLEPLPTLAPKQQIECVAVLPDGSTIFSGTTQGTIDNWSLSTQSMIRSVQAHERECLSLATSPDGSLLASGGADGSVKLWDAATLTPLWSVQPRRGEVSSVSFSDDAATLIATFRDKAFIMYPLSKMNQPLRGNEAYQRSLRKQAP